MNKSTLWYIVKTDLENCEIITLEPDKQPEAKQYWGPFKSKHEAITRRVGLIRSGKCKPV